MNKELEEQIKNMTPEQRSLLSKKIKLEDLAYFVKLIVPDFSVEFIKERLKYFDGSNGKSCTFQGRRKFITICKPLKNSVKLPRKGLFIIDDEIAEIIDNPSQEQLAESWKWLSKQNFAQRWAKGDICGKMLDGKL